jgi:hypothetical protein
MKFIGAEIKAFLKNAPAMLIARSNCFAAIGSDML